MPLTGAVSQAGALDLHELSRLGTSDGVVHQLLAGTPAEVPHRYDAASPARRLPIGVPLLLVHGARDDDVPGAHLARVRRRRDRGGRRLRAGRDRRREPLRAPGAELAVRGGRWSSGCRADARARRRARRRRPAGGLPRPLRASPTRSGSTSTATRSAGCRSPRATACATSSTSGATGSCRDGRTGSTRRRASATRSPRACSARARARCSWPTRRRSTCSSSARPRSTPRSLSAQRALVTDRDNFPTDRYVLEGLAEQRGLELRTIEADPLDGPQPRAISRRVLHDGAVALVVLSHVAYRSGALADMRALTERRPPLRRARGVGPLALGRRGPGASCATRASSWRSAAPTSTSTPARARPRTCTRRRRCCRGCARRSGAGSASATSSRWSAPYDPVDGIGRFLAGTPPVLDLAAVEEGVQAHRRGRRRAPAREVRRPLRADRSRCTTRGWRRSGSSSARRATRSAADRTCRCATRRRGRSAAR